MKKDRSLSDPSCSGYVLGDSAFAAITAVEGMSLSGASRTRLEVMKKRRLTVEEQRLEVIRAYLEAKIR